MKGTVLVTGRKKILILLGWFLNVTLLKQYYTEHKGPFPALVALRQSTWYCAEREVVSVKRTVCKYHLQLYGDRVSCKALVL